MATPARTDTEVLLGEYMRVAAFAIAAYDYLATVPAEWMLYRQQWERRRISSSCILFAAVRYLSIIALVVNGVGFFDKGWDISDCQRFFLVPQTFKMLAGWCAQAIIFMRTLAIAGRTRPALIILGLLTFISAPVQIFGNYYARYASQDDGNCIARVTKGRYNSAPLYYAGSVLFDVGACALGTLYLVRQAQGLPILKFTRSVLKHGLLYAFATTLANLLVLLAVLGLPGIKGLGSTLAITVTSILAQRLVFVTNRLLTQPTSQPSMGTVHVRRGSSDRFVMPSPSTPSRSYSYKSHTDVPPLQHSKSRSKSRSKGGKHMGGGMPMVTTTTIEFRDNDGAYLDDYLDDDSDVDKRTAGLKMDKSPSSSSTVGGPEGRRTAAVGVDEDLEMGRDVKRSVDEIEMGPVRINLGRREGVDDDETLYGTTIRDSDLSGSEPDGRRRIHGSEEGHTHVKR